MGWGERARKGLGPGCHSFHEGRGPADNRQLRIEHSNRPLPRVDRSLSVAIWGIRRDGEESTDRAGRGNRQAANFRDGNPKLGLFDWAFVDFSTQPLVKNRPGTVGVDILVDQLLEVV